MSWQDAKNKTKSTLQKFEGTASFWQDKSKAYAAANTYLVWITYRNICVSDLQLLYKKWIFILWGDYTCISRAV